MAFIDIVTANPLVSGIVATTVGGGIIELSRRRHQEKQRARGWFGNVSGLLSNVQQAARKATAYRDGVDYEILYERLDGLDEKMMRKANNAPKRVSNSARIELAFIAAYVTGLTSLAEKNTDTEPLDLVRDVQSDAIENYDGDYDMDDLESMFSSFEFGKISEDIDREVEVNEGMAETFRSRFSEESLEAGYPTTIEEALNLPIEEAKMAFETQGALNTVLDDSMEMFVDMVIKLVKDTHERMEMRKEEV